MSVLHKSLFLTRLSAPPVLSHWEIKVAATICTKGFLQKGTCGFYRLPRAISTLTIGTVQSHGNGVFSPLVKLGLPSCLPFPEVNIQTLDNESALLKDAHCAQVT